MHCLKCRKQVEKVGLELWGEEICEDCLQRLLTLTPLQSEYDYFVKTIRVLWEKKYFTMQPSPTGE